MTIPLVQLTINSRPVSVPAGTTVMQATKQLGVDVPHYCWHPGLSVAGVCRFCMVKIEGMPKLQIACNTTVTEGMKVDTLAPEVKEAHKWALEFHLINHPLDCPICDQAGECELQNYYMKVGRYDSQMTKNKVLKPKALDVGDTLVLDTERCILCSRCVRFEDEVTKTSTLGIFNRGDQAVIGTFEGRKIKHNYSYNLADICPVGAFTSKDFRFKMRVWFMQELKTVCPGCSTGCNVTLFYNKNQRTALRLKPRYNPEVNGHWMCDKGRFMYEHINASERAAHAFSEGVTLEAQAALARLGGFFEGVQNDPAALGVVLTAQYTNEEYETLFGFLKARYGVLPSFYLWQDPTDNKEEFDGILWRGDKNPNTAGLQNCAAKHSVTLKEFPLNALGTLPHSALLVMGPEVERNYPGLTQTLQALGAWKGRVCYFGTAKDTVSAGFWLRMPTLVYAEKKGTFTNVKGLTQGLQPAPQVYAGISDLAGVFGALASLKPAPTGT